MILNLAVDDVESSIHAISCPSWEAGAFLETLEVSKTMMKPRETLLFCHYGLSWRLLVLTLLTGRLSVLALGQSRITSSVEVSCPQCRSKQVSKVSNLEVSCRRHQSALEKRHPVIKAIVVLTIAPEVWREKAWLL